MNASRNRVGSMSRPLDNLNMSFRSCEGVRLPKSSRWNIWWCLCQTDVLVLRSSSCFSVWYEVLIRVFSLYNSKFWDKSVGRFRRMELHLILSSVIWQASNQISMRVSQVGMSPETQVGCGKDILVEVGGIEFSIRFV